MKPKLVTHRGEMLATFSTLPSVVTSITYKMSVLLEHDYSEVDVAMTQTRFSKGKVWLSVILFVHVKVFPFLS